VGFHWENHKVEILYDVFISYGTKDGIEQAQFLYTELTQRGKRVWWDKNNIRLGESWIQEIATGIEQSAKMIFLMSPHAIRKESICHNEIVHALNKRKPILPVLLMPCDTPFVLNTHQYLAWIADPQRIIDHLEAWLEGKHLPPHLFLKNGQPLYTLPKVVIPRDEWVQNHFNRFFDSPTYYHQHIHLITAEGLHGKTHMLHVLKGYAEQSDHFIVLMVGAKGATGNNRHPSQSIPSILNDLWAQVRVYDVTKPYWEIAQSADQLSNQLGRLRGALHALAKSQSKQVLLLMDDLHLSHDPTFHQWLRSCVKGHPIYIIATCQVDTLNPLPQAEVSTYKHHTLPALQVQELGSLLAPPDYEFARHVLEICQHNLTIVSTCLSLYADDLLLVADGDGHWRCEQPDAEDYGLPNLWENNMETAIEVASEVLQTSTDDRENYNYERDGILEVLTCAAIVGDSISLDMLLGTFAEDGWTEATLSQLLQQLSEFNPPIFKTEASPLYTHPTHWWSWASQAWRWWILTHPEIRAELRAYHAEKLFEHLQKRLHPHLDWYFFYDLASYALQQRIYDNPNHVENSLAYQQRNRYVGWLEQETRVRWLQAQLGWLQEEKAPPHQTYPLWRELGLLMVYGDTPRPDVAEAFRTARQQAQQVQAEVDEVVNLFYLEAIVSPSPIALDLLTSAWQHFPNVGQYPPDAPEVTRWLEDKRRPLHTVLFPQQLPIGRRLLSISITQSKMAALYVKLGRNEEALSLYEQSLKTKETLKDPRSIAVTQSKMAALYVTLGRNEEALSLYEQSLKTLETLKDPREIAVTQSSMADLYVKLGRNEEALSLYEQALQAFEALKAPTWIAYTQRAILALGEPRESK